jgi:hypothetical protein
MSFKENLKVKISLDRLLQTLVSTLREPPGRRWLDKGLTKEHLARMDDLALLRNIPFFLSQPRLGTFSRLSGLSPR